MEMSRLSTGGGAMTREILKALGFLFIAASVVLWMALAFGGL